MDEKILFLLGISEDIFGNVHKKMDTKLNFKVNKTLILFLHLIQKFNLLIILITGR